MIPLLIILGILLLILLLPVGAHVRYDGAVTVRLCLGPVRLQVVPAKPKTRKQLEKEQKKKEESARKKAEKKEKAKADKLIQKDPPPPRPKQSALEKVRGLLPFARLATDALGSVFHKLTVKLLVVHVRFGDSDKARLADSYGKIMAAIWSMGPILGRAFRVKKSDISVVPDFLSDSTQVEAELYIRYFVFDLIGIAFKYGLRGVKLLLAKKKQEKQLLAQQQAEEAAAQAQSADKPSQNNVEKAV